jgi:hypothetical protein
LRTKNYSPFRKALKELKISDGPKAPECNMKSIERDSKAVSYSKILANPTLDIFHKIQVP